MDIKIILPSADIRIVSMKALPRKGERVILPEGKFDIQAVIHTLEASKEKMPQVLLHNPIA